MPIRKARLLSGLTNAHEILLQLQQDLIVFVQ